jgi:rod shape-determining protein MreD
MIKINRNNILENLYKYSPIILLFMSVLNEFDFNYLGLKYFSFNFVYILIFYYNLKKTKGFGYGLIFIAGLFNDVVVGTPIGLSSLVYLLLCGAAAYLRNITLRPNLIKDWIFFLITILTINSIYLFILIYIFDYKIIIFNQIANIIFTFIFYPFFTYLFNSIKKISIGSY